MTRTTPNSDRGRTVRHAIAVFLKFAAPLAATAFVAILLLGLAGVFRDKVSETKPVPRAVSATLQPQVEVHIIKQPRYETSVGSVQPVHEAAVASKLLARIVEVNVTAGQSVQEGEVLVRLDDADLQARLSQAQSGEASALARKQQADSEFERAATLLEKKAVSQAAYDQAASAVKSATSDWERAQQAVREAQVTLDYATIRAPLSGIVVDKRVEPGDTATPGEVLLTLYNPTKMQLVASVRESLAQRLAVGQTLPAQLDALDHECLATISEIVPQAATASRSFAVKVIGPCPPGVYSGMFGRLKIPLDEEEILVVPASAVRRIGQLTMVDVVVSGTIQRRHVQLGRRINDEFEVLSGLRAGEKALVHSPDAAEN